MGFPFGDTFHFRGLHAVELVLVVTLLGEDPFGPLQHGGKQWFSPQEIEVERDDKGATIQCKHIRDGETVLHAGMSKMSKSKNNGIET